MKIAYTRDPKTDLIVVESADPLVTKMFMPNDEEKRLIADTQVFLDTMSWTVNPKAMTSADFFGVYNNENNEWKDGCITSILK